MIYNLVSLIAVAALWGCTNPFIKKGSKDIVKIKANNAIYQFLLELKYLFSNINYIVPMSINQAGSVLYFLTLQSAELSLAVPLANSLTFVFTAIIGWLLKEDIPNKSTNLGILSILLGTFLCCFAKVM